MDGTDQRRRKFVSPVKALKLLVRKIKEHIARCAEIDKANGRGTFVARKVSKMTDRKGDAEGNPMRHAKSSSKKKIGKKKYSDLSDSDNEEEFGLEMKNSTVLTHRRSPGKLVDNNVDIS